MPMRRNTPMPTPRPIAALLIAACCLAGGLSVQAQDQAPQTPSQPEPTQPDVKPQPEPAPVPDPEPTLVARELVVLQFDTYGERVNDPIQVRTTLTTPIDHAGRRKLEADHGGYANSPMPLGLISFEGPLDAPLKVQLDLTGDAARFHGHWPSDALTNPRMIQWPQLRPAEEDQPAYPIGGGGHWLETLRESEARLWLTGREAPRQLVRPKERFLIYDASFPFKPALSLSLNDKTYQAKSALPADQTPPLTMLVHHNNADWAAGTLAGPWDKTEGSLGTRPGEPADYSPILKPVLQPLADLLAQRGHTPTEIKLALEMVKSAGLESSAMSLVYVMPQGMIDQQIQLTILPAPDQIIRTAIVVVTNADPDLSSQIKRLITDLGSDQWIKRDQAHRALEGKQAAIKQLQEARTNPDPEIAFRAQQLLDAYDLKTEADR